MTGPAPKLADLRSVIPNWRDPSAYPDTKGLSPSQLAAEFLRRNRDYQSWWQDQLDADETGSITKLDFEGLKRFGLALPIGTDGIAHLAFFLPTAARILNGSALRENDVAYVFDLSLPLDEQIAVAARDLKGFQQHRIKQGNTISAQGTKQVRTQNYVLYLRILDAEVSGATDAEIGAAFYPELDDDYPDRRRTKRLSDDRKVAHRLRDGGYLRLAAKTRARSKRS